MWVCLKIRYSHLSIPGDLSIAVGYLIFTQTNVSEESHIVVVKCCNMLKFRLHVILAGKILIQPSLMGLSDRRSKPLYIIRMTSSINELRVGMGSDPTKMISIKLRSVFAPDTIILPSFSRLRLNPPTVYHSPR